MQGPARDRRLNDPPALLEETVAAVLCPRFPLGLEGLDFGDGGARPLPGGFCVFRRELPAALDVLAEVRARGGGRFPWVAADLERGAGHQIDGLTRLPPALALGAADDPGLARAAGECTAREARAAGVAVVFAPVLDLADEPRNPIVAARAFGRDPERVAALGAAWIAGCRTGGAAATAKHYPGHGATLVDSHLELPVVTRPADAFTRTDEAPFRAAIEAGVPAVMVGHLHAPFLDPEPGPASLSAAVVAARLRRRLGFQGVVFTDALDMGGATAAGEEPAVRAVRAGCDVALLPADPDRAARALRDAVHAGTLPLARLQEAAARSRALAQAFPVPAAPARVALPAAAAVALEIARRSVVLAAGGRAPVLPAGPVELDVLDDGAGAAALPWLRDALAKVGRAPAVRAGPGGGGAPRVIVLFSDVRAFKGRIALDDATRARLAATWAADVPLLVVGPPQCIAGLPAPGPRLHVFGDDPASLTAAAEALAGRLVPGGTACW